MLIPVERRPPLPERPYWLFNDDPWDDDKVSAAVYSAVLVRMCASD